MRPGRIAFPKPPAPRTIRRPWRRCASSSSPPQSGVDSASTRSHIFVSDPSDAIAQTYVSSRQQAAQTQSLGADPAPIYRPHELVTHPPRPQDITLELLLAAQAHLGHATALWHPGNARYIFGIRGRKEQGEEPIHIIGLDVTAAHLRRACRVVRGVCERGGLVLFVGTREGQARAVAKAAELSRGCHLFTKWVPGAITNGQQILGRCEKRVVDELDHPVDGFAAQLEKTAALKPDLVVCANPLENYVLLHECGLHGIPTIGIVDTDCNPTWVTYPIPANDDSLRCVQVIVGALGRAGEEGQATRLEKAARGVIEYPANHSLLPPTAKERSKPRRVPRRTPFPTPAGAGELNYPADLVGVPVDQHLKDQVLLDQAEGEVLAMNRAGRGTHDGVNELSVAPEEDDELENLARSIIRDEVELTDDFAEPSLVGGDVNQFAGTSTPDDATPVGSETGGNESSTWDQVGEVESELGEQAPDNKPARQSGLPSDAVPAESGENGSNNLPPQGSK